MKILNYVRSLLPEIEKKTVLEDLFVLKEDISEVTLAQYISNNDFFSNKRFTNEFIKSFDSQMKREISRYKKNCIETIKVALENTLVNVDKQIAIFTNMKGKLILKDNVTALLANRLQFIQLATFGTEYSRRFLLLLQALEQKDSPSKEEYLASREFFRAKEWLDNDRDNFFSVLKLLLKTPKELETTFSEIPDIAIDPDSEVDPSIVNGISRLDPIFSGILPKPINFIYQIRMFRTNLRLKRHTLLLEEKQQLELQILMLKQQSEGNDDPKLQKELEYKSERIEKLRYEIDRIEEQDNVK